MQIGGRQVPLLTGSTGGRTGIRRTFLHLFRRFRAREMAISTCATAGVNTTHLSQRICTQYVLSLCAFCLLWRRISRVFSPSFQHEFLSRCRVNSRLVTMLSSFPVSVFFLRNLVDRDLTEYQTTQTMMLS